jgi:hypothetical protein
VTSVNPLPALRQPSRSGAEGIKGGETVVDRFVSILPNIWAGAAFLSALAPAAVARRP